MTEVLFYHLERQRIEDVLPVLLEKSRARGWRAVVEVVDDARREALDRALWTFRDDSFLPHGTDADSHPAHQPILLTRRPGNANGAAIRFIDGGTAPLDAADYARVVLLFSALDEPAVAAARGSWVTLRAAGHAVTYWRQDDAGHWNRRA